MKIDVVDDTEASRFEAFADGDLAGFIAYSIANGQIALVHTEIENAYEGKGVGSTLVRHALHMVRETGRALLPVCPFVRAYVQRHPEYVDLVPSEQRSRFDLPPVNDCA